MAGSNGRATTGDSFIVQFFPCHYGWEGGARLLVHCPAGQCFLQCVTLVKTVTVSKGRVWLLDGSFAENICLNTTVWL